MNIYLTKLNKKVYLGLSLVGAGILYLKVLSPKFGIHIPCLFRSITGHYCPGCGMTRAALSILDGDIYQAFRYNMLVFILLPLMLVYTLMERNEKTKQSKFLMLFMLVLTILFGVLRNLSLFSWLAPTKI
ncbi:DUF2752 domain-containing protein [Amphibacillus sediminis]|uniref:DUF2752 domain-containing protein n=1 Tax=Amphibacillus sediminis TaxID=360185 RepID=UPI00083149CB|nr:DUF2752 domain-containing protein [Amphibacillus sediminis]